MSRPIGIDLGTTVSVVANVDEDGRAHILSDEDGECYIPSVVLIEPDDVLVGQEAKDMAVAMPEETIACVKRYMDDPMWRFFVHDREYSAEEISSFILKRMKAVAEHTLGSVHQAVITVPAYFHDAQRQATTNAAKLAGLEVLKIINEPTAAALSYGFMEEDSDRTYLVYDLGGGTFDVTVMKSLGGVEFETITTRGNHRLGGRDWDERICDFLVEEFEREHGIDPRDDAASHANLFLIAERAKIALSQANKTRTVVQHSGKTMTTELTRTRFEELTEELLDLTRVEVDLALSEAKLTPDQVDIVLLVGGSSKMPMVSDLLRPKGARIKNESPS